MAESNNSAYAERIKPPVKEWLLLLREHPTAFNSFLADLEEMKQALYASYPAARDHDAKKEIDGQVTFVLRWLHSVTVEDKQAVAHQKFLSTLEEGRQQNGGRTESSTIGRYNG